jgi:hypothetical protein
MPPHTGGLTLSTIPSALRPTEASAANALDVRRAASTVALPRLRGACSACGAVRSSVKSCGACGLAQYCNKEVTAAAMYALRRCPGHVLTARPHSRPQCQHGHWREHKSACRAARAEQQPASGSVDAAVA